MEWIVSDWFLIVAALSVIAMSIYVVIDFGNLPREQQLEQVREWLLYAVIEAERLLGGSTGQLKLALVFDMFAERFPMLVKVINFETFAELVDDALVEMRELLENNKAIKAVVDGELP